MLGAFDFWSWDLGMIRESTVQERSLLEGMTKEGSSISTT